ncbi:Uncharacterized protein GBIM_09651, partial [Gryllus bimaculatus]
QHCLPLIFPSKNVRQSTCFSRANNRCGAEVKRSDGKLIRRLFCKNTHKKSLLDQDYRRKLRPRSIASRTCSGNRTVTPGSWAVRVRILEPSGAAPPGNENEPIALSLMVTSHCRHPLRCVFTLAKHAGRLESHTKCSDLGTGVPHNHLKAPHAPREDLLYTMCPLWPFHVFLIYGIILGPLWMMTSAAVNQMMHTWNVSFEPSSLLNIPIGSLNTVSFETYDLTPEEIQYGVVSVQIENAGHDSVEPVDKIYILNTEPMNDHYWSSAFNISANFLGYAKARLKLKSINDDRTLKTSNALNITVVREEKAIDKAFTWSVATLVSIIYINFGCAIEPDIVKKTLKRPIGPVIGFMSQFVVMPLVSFGLAKVLFPESLAMQLGMFFTGVSPAGGASNIWTVTLGGNLNLSITMTTISTFAAFVMIPVWIFTLGQLIFAAANTKIPYARIASIAVGLVIPLSIGLALQRFCPKIAKFMARILRPFSIILILFIVIFAIITNYYIFKLFSWQIVVAGLGLPWLGFVFGGLLGHVFRQPPMDILAIAIETGIQNTGIAIFMLRFSLKQPEADLTTVVPVAVAIMTPLPLALWYVIKKFQAYSSQKRNIRSQGT